MSNQHRRHAVALLSLLAALQGSGCSWMFVTPPSQAASPSHVDDSCTKSKVAPVLDSVGAGYQVVRTVFAATAAQSVYDDPDAPLTREADIGFGVAWTTVLLASAYYGFSKTAQCRERQAGHQWAADEQPDYDASPRFHRVGEGYRDARTERRAAPPAAATPAPPASVPPVAPAPAPTSTMPAEVIPVPTTPAPSAPAAVTPAAASSAQ